MQRIPRRSAISLIAKRPFSSRSQCLAERPSTTVADEDDYYALLLSDPVPTAAKRSIGPSTPAKSPPVSSSPATPVTSTSDATKPPENKISFSAPLAGPSARMRGLARGEQGLGRPPEPDNCCMSGCVNCVWDAYREEIEEWAAGRKRREAQLQANTPRAQKVRAQAQEDSSAEGSVGDLDDAGSLSGYENIDVDGDSGLFEGIPVGIKEFMKQEKRLRAKREREKG